MTSRIITILILLVISSIAPAEQVKGKAFYQSHESMHPAREGFVRGMLLLGPLDSEGWPTDMVETMPEFTTSKSALAIKYEALNAYPSYELWVRIGNLFTSILILLLGILFVQSRRAKENA